MKLYIICSPENKARENIGFKLYRIADYDEDNIVNTDKHQYHSQYSRKYRSAYPFQDSGIIPDEFSKEFQGFSNDKGNETSAQLREYISAKGIEPVFQGVTDEKGELTVEGLDEGIYFIDSDTILKLDDGKRYTPVPLFFFQDSQSSQSISVKIKAFDSEDIEIYEIVSDEFDPEDNELYEIMSEEPVFGSSDIEKEKPEEMDIVPNIAHINYYDAGIIETIDINGRRISADGKKEAIESGKVYLGDNTIGDNTIELKEEDLSFANLSNEENEDGTKSLHSVQLPSSMLPGEKKTLPQTGLLWWPVPLLIFLGVILYIIGFLKCKKMRRSCKGSP